MRPGYKQSDVGEIPVDWSANALSAMTDPKRPISYGIVQTGPSVPNGVKCLRVLDINDGRINKTELITTTETISSAYKRTTLSVGDLVMPLRGKVGDVGLVDEDLEGANLTRGVALIALRPGWSPAYCKQVISWPVTRNRLEQSMNGSALQEIPIATLRSFRIPVPATLAEQAAIAEALSGVDELLAGLDRLIAKKRDLKQAAMQQLLTGQTRLPGFHGEWAIQRLGELADMGSGGTPLSSVPAFYGGGIPWVSIADMTSSGRLIAATEKTLTSLGVERSAAQLFPAGTVLYAMYASLGECCIAGVPVTTSQAILGIRPKQRLIGEFLYYLLISMKATVRTLGQQGTQANLNKGIVQDFRIALPSREEQIAIATVLSDMDAELSALEARRDKTRALKQGMMQELLTGRTRLV